MKFRTVVPALGLLFLAACGKPSNEEQITRLEEKIRAEEMKIRDGKSRIRDMRGEIAALGGDTLVPVDSVNITVVRAERGDYSEYVDLAATVSSRENLMISSDMGGRIVSVRVREGQRVGRGQILAEVDGEVIRKQIAELENALSLAQTVYEKRKRLWDQQIGSEVEYLQAENNVQSLEKSLATAQAQLEKTYVRSPISGTVDKVILHAGEMAGPGQPILRVVNLDRVQVKADVSEAYLGTIKPGDEVIVRFPSIGLDDKARVTAVGQVIDPNNRTFTLEVELNNPGDRLVPNLVGSISLLTSHQKAQVLVPSRLLQSGYNGSFVFLVDSTLHQAYRRDVEIGSSYGGRTVIKSGLKAGDWLVNDGFRNVSDSSFVRIKHL